MTAQVISFQKKKQESIEKKKRQFERVLFQEFVGCYITLEGEQTTTKGKSLYALQLVDVSKNGCLLQIEDAPKVDDFFTVGKTINLRLYFTKSSYLPAEVQLRRVDWLMMGGKRLLRVGCEFNQSQQSYQAIVAMVHFLYSYAEHSQVQQTSYRSLFL